MSQQTVQNTESQLIAELVKLNKSLQSSNSWWRMVMRGMLYAVGSVVGFLIVAILSGVFLWRTATKNNWTSQVESMIGQKVQEQVRSQVGQSVPKNLKLPASIDQNTIDAFLKNMR